MAYTQVWDPTKPADGDPVSQGDEEIRRIKLAIDERLATVFPNWPNGDPLTIQADGDILQDAFTYYADNSAGTRASHTAPALILFLRVQGTTDGSGGLTVSFNESGFGGDYAVSNLISVLATQRNGASTGTIISYNVGANTLTLDTDYAVPTAVVWDLILVFSA